LTILYLLRHAKAADRELYESDFERPLAKRGIQACKAMSEYLTANSVHVDRVFCSTAQRTRETFELIKKPLRNSKVSYQEKFYLMDAADLMEFIAGLPDAANSVMVIGHNPGLHIAALRLMREADKKTPKTWTP